ncbi:MAG: carbohydrate binding family 9 domain-containing protein [Marinicaulis sp.]|nr:carbohydrate binding family 9 domain-containing protein [Marinicaulis sp.]
MLRPSRLWGLLSIEGRMVRGVVSFAIAVFFGLAFSPAGALQDSESTAARDFANYVPRVEAVKIDRDDRPIIDGNLNDPVWRRANVIDEFYQVEPVDGGEPSQPTKAYILFDETTLYVGIYAYDDEPDLIRRQQLKRDPQLRDEDGLRIIIDSFGTFRNAYFFAVNANGARADLLTQNNNSIRPEWDAIWNAKARVVEDGWIAEFAIPFQSISFDADLTEWNLQIIRTIRRNSEEIRWSNIDRSRGRIDITNPGRLAGIEGIDSGIGLEAQLFVTGSGSYDWELDEFDTGFNPSANVFYKLTPSLTGSLTFNTDFSDSPLDERQVNTGRFSLFFPETRDFFLQDASVFEFGNELFSRTTNGLPLFTRRIGNVDGSPVDIIAGAKVSGKHGPFDIGMIATRTGSQDALGINGQFLTAGRVSTNVFGESNAGLIFTHGDPDGSSTNTVTGGDFQYKNSTRFNGTITADLVYLRSFTDGVEDDLFGVAVDYTGDKYGYNVVVREIGENYDPQLGFANRTGLRQYRAFGRRRFRPDSGPIRNYTIGVFTNTLTDLDDAVTDRFLGGFFDLNNNPGDNLHFEIENAYVDIRESFEIADVVTVPVGEYDYWQYDFRADTSRARSIALGARARVGGIYDGNFRSYGGEFLWRPSKHIELEVEYDYTKFDLPSGEVGIHVASIESVVSFTPDMFIATDIQYDNISENFTLFSRFIWEPQPEQEVFISLGHTGTIREDDFPSSFRSVGTGVALRLGHTIRM